MIIPNKKNMVNIKSPSFVFFFFIIMTQNFLLISCPLFSMCQTNLMFLDPSNNINCFNFMSKMYKIQETENTENKKSRKPKNKKNSFLQNILLRKF